LSCEKNFFCFFAFGLTDPPSKILVIVQWQYRDNSSRQPVLYRYKPNIISEAIKEEVISVKPWLPSRIHNEFAVQDIGNFLAAKRCALSDPHKCMPRKMREGLRIPRLLKFASVLRGERPQI
jgi:hypothetical protein